MKWENVKVLHSPLTNYIYLGKLNKDGTSSDKSEDRTNEILSVAMVHLDTWCSMNGEKSVVITCPAGTLTWEKKC